MISQESESKQGKWDKLYGKINSLLKLSENLPHRIKQNMHKKYPPQMMYYTFDIWIERKGGIPFPSKVLRKIKISGLKSLYNFARVITGAFGFYFDHCFGYYDNFQRYHDSKMSYELFVDIGEERLSPKTKGVKNTKIWQVFKEP